VPELSRFYGIVVRMFVEAGAQHHRPHLHAYYQELVGIFAVDISSSSLVSFRFPSSVLSLLGPSFTSRSF